jgi:hypothetical protein
VAHGHGEKADPDLYHESKDRRGRLLLKTACPLFTEKLLALRKKHIILDAFGYLILDAFVFFGGPEKHLILYALHSNYQLGTALPV